MKTLKRKDILKQYYTSEDESDSELKSTSSDPYDCIVINDHLVRKDDKLRRQNPHQHQHQQQQMEFHTFRSSTSTTATNTLKKSNSKQEQESTLTRNSTAGNAGAGGAPTATILPRTRLLKSSSSNNNNNNSHNNSNNNHSSATLERNLKAHVGNKSYGPWYDFWDQEQHGHPGQKSSSAKLKWDRR